MRRHRVSYRKLSLFPNANSGCWRELTNTNYSKICICGTPSLIECQQGIHIVELLTGEQHMGLLYNHFLAATMISTSTSTTTLISTQKSILVFVVLYSYLFVSTSYLLAICILILASFMLVSASLILAPTPTIREEVSIAIFFTSCISLQIILISWSSSLSRPACSDSMFGFIICVCQRPCLMLDSLMHWSLRTSSFLSISSGVKVSRNSLTLALSRPIFSESSSSSNRFFCFSRNEACSFLKARIKGLISLMLATMILDLRDCKLSMEVQMELPNFSMSFPFSSVELIVFISQYAFDLRRRIYSVYMASH